MALALFPENHSQASALPKWKEHQRRRPISTPVHRVISGDLARVAESGLLTTPHLSSVFNIRNLTFIALVAIGALGSFQAYQNNQAQLSSQPYRTAYSECITNGPYGENNTIGEASYQFREQFGKGLECKDLGDNNHYLNIVVD